MIGCQWNPKYIFVADVTQQRKVVLSQYTRTPARFIQERTLTHKEPLTPNQHGFRKTNLRSLG